MKEQFMNTHVRVGALEKFVGNMGQNVAGDITHLNMQLTARLLVAEKVHDNGGQYGGKYDAHT
eukprot:8734939-Pyramimonas_sp.AAC.1